MPWPPAIATLTLGAVLLLAPQLPRDQATPTTRAGTASIRGVVSVTMDSRTEPVRRAGVILRPASGGDAVMTDTDTNGAFTAQGLAAGTWRIDAQKPGVVSLGRPTLVDLRDGESATVTIRLQPGAAIQGRILDPRGRPVEGLTVSAARLGFGPYGKKIVAYQQATTDDLGRYRVHTLLPGEYYIEAAPDTRLLVAAPTEPGPAVKPVRTYYPGTARLDEARSVVVGVGEEVPGLDFAAVTAITSRLSARITTASGGAPATFSVRLQPAGAPPGVVPCSPGLAGTGADSFLCPYVPPGDYWLLVAGQASRDAVPEFSATRLTIDREHHENLAIVTAPGTTLVGRVEVERGGPVPANLAVAAFETEYEFPPLSSGGSPAAATPPAAVRPDGAFALGGLAGPRLLRVTGLPAGWALSGVRLGELDVTDTPVAFSASDAARGVRVILTRTTAAVEGLVLDRDGQPAAGARVVVFSTDPTRWGARSRFIRSVETNAAGRYAIDGLLPGPYLVIAADRFDDGAWEDPEVLARLQALASPIAAAAGHIALDLRLR